MFLNSKYKLGMKRIKTGGINTGIVFNVTNEHQ